MTPLRRRVLMPAWGALLIATGLAGCSPGEEPAPTPEPTVVAPPTTPESSPPSEATSLPPSSMPDPSPSSSWDEEQTAAAETVMEFFRLKNMLSQDPNLDVQPLVDITTGQTQEIQVSTLAEDREAGIVQTGDDLYYITEIEQVVEDALGPMVLAHVCTDSTATDLIDEDTQETVLGSDRAYFVEWQIEVSLEQDRWKVGDITSGRVELCGP